MPARLHAINPDAFESMVNTIDPQVIMERLRDLDAQTRSMRELLRIVRTRRRWRDRAVGDAVPATSRPARAN
jgi:hypothetical protein